MGKMNKAIVRKTIADDRRLFYISDFQHMTYTSYAIY